MRMKLNTLPPKLLIINDISGVGRCSMSVSLPVVSACKVQGIPVPTSVLSNHLGFPLCHFDDYTSHMRDYIKVWNELGLTFDGLYCGFLGNEEQIDIVREFVEMFRPPLFLLDHADFTDSYFLFYFSVALCLCYFVFLLSVFSICQHAGISFQPDLSGYSHRQISRCSFDKTVSESDSAGECRHRLIGKACDNKLV